MYPFAATKPAITKAIKTRIVMTLLSVSMWVLGECGGETNGEKSATRSIACVGGTRRLLETAQKGVFADKSAVGLLRSGRSPKSLLVSPDS
jgi:hypothetical protein